MYSPDPSRGLALPRICVPSLTSGLTARNVWLRSETPSSFVDAPSPDPAVRTLGLTGLTAGHFLCVAVNAGGGIVSAPINGDAVASRGISDAAGYDSSRGAPGGSFTKPLA